MSTHAQLTEHSVSHSLITPIGKGREGKGIGSGGDESFQDLPLQRPVTKGARLATAGAAR